MRSFRLVPSRLLLFTVPVALLAASPERLREVRLDVNLREPAGWMALARHPVFDLAFSPDGKYVAATMDEHLEPTGEARLIRRTHLLIVDVQQPGIAARQIDMETCPKSLEWAPDSTAILVCDRLVELSDGRSCDLAQTGDQLFRRQLERRGASYWIDSQRLIQLDRTIVDRSCQRVGIWDVAGWFVAGTAPDRGWILVFRQPEQTINGRTSRVSNYALADFRSASVMSGLLLPPGYAGDTPAVVESSETVCTQLALLVDRDQHELRCWKIPHGDPLPVAQQIKDYRVTQAARSAPRVIAERWDYPMGTKILQNLFGYTEGILELQTVDVVDIDAGRAVVGVAPAPQALGSSRPRDGWPMYALSSDGKMLAEGRNGTITLYRVP